MVKPGLCTIILFGAFYLHIDVRVLDGCSKSYHFFKVIGFLSIKVLKGVWFQDINFAHDIYFLIQKFFTILSRS